MPHTLVVVMALVILVLALSWVVPSGEYQRVEVKTSEGVRNVTVAGTYHQVEKVYLGPQMVLVSPIKGFLDGALLICFLLMIGGSFAIFQETGAVEFGIRRLTDVDHARGRPSRGMLIPVLMIVFSLAGSIFGMAEETIPFVLIFIPLARAPRLRLDRRRVDPVPRRGGRVRGGLLQPVHRRHLAEHRRPPALLRPRLPRSHLVHRHGRDHRLRDVVRARG